MHNIENKILICIQNYYVIENLQNIIEKLSNNYSITLIITNQNLNLDKENINYFKKKFKVEKLIILDLYKNEKKNILGLTKSLLKIQKLLVNCDFKACIVDNNIEIWLKVITDYFKKKEKKIIGLKHDSLALNTAKVKEFLLNGDINMILNTSHKLRDTYTDIPKSTKQFSLLKKIKKASLLFFERYLIPLFIFKKTFAFTKLDLTTGFDDKTIEYVICFFYTSYIFWGSLYGFNKTFYVSYEKNCNCIKKKTKKKQNFIYC